MRLTLAVIAASFVACAAPPGRSPETAGTTLHVVVGTTGPVSIAGTRVDADNFDAIARTSLERHRAASIDADGNVPFRIVAEVAERLRHDGATTVTTGAVLGANAPAGVPTAAPAIPHASVAATTKWDCAFPADTARNRADVLVKVTVEPDGKPSDVDILEDPGAGFAKAARTCALTKAYEPAKDPSGATMRAATFPFYVRFVAR
jgi:hypothetical protein